MFGCKCSDDAIGAFAGTAMGVDLLSESVVVIVTVLIQT